MRAERREKLAVAGVGWGVALIALGGSLALAALASPARPAEAAPAAAGASAVVYDNDLNPDWTDWSWRIRVSLDHRGSHSSGRDIAARYTGAFAGLSFHSNLGIDPRVYRHLRFRLRPAVKHQEFVIVIRDASDHDQGPDYHLPGVGSKKQFQDFDVPLSVFGRSLPTIHRFVIEDASGHPPSKKFLVDQIRFTP